MKVATFILKVFDPETDPGFTGMVPVGDESDL